MISIEIIWITLYLATAIRFLGEFIEMPCNRLEEGGARRKMERITEDKKHRVVQLYVWETVQNIACEQGKSDQYSLD